MGREVKRVALDFEWPRNMVWKGFLNPHSSQPCKPCDQSGYNPATKEISDRWYSLGEARWISLGNGRRYNDLAWSHHLTADEVEALAKAGRLYDFTHTWEVGRGWAPKDPPCMPTPEEVNAWSLSGMGHDSINHFICVKVRARRLGVYGKCKVCKGEGEIWQSPEIQKLHDDWQPFGPPPGDGFQMWETTSEGSPISPVFPTAEALARWLADTNASAFGGEGATYEQWLRVCGGGYAPSAVADERGFRPGVAL